MAALVGLSALGFATVVPNYVTNARLQLSVNSANTELLRYVESEVPAGEAVMLAIPEGSEYARMFEIYVRDLGVRQDIQLLGFDADRPIPEGAHEFLALSPFVENQFYPSVRLGVFELPSPRLSVSLARRLGRRGTAGARDTSHLHALQH